MPYGTIKIDTVTFTDAGVDKSVTLSGLVQNPTFSGNVTVTGTLSGVTVTGTTANFTSGNFTNISGGTHTITSGVFAAGSAASPSITFTGDLNTGIYSPGADQVAISTGGSGRLFVDASGNVGVGTNSLSTVFRTTINGNGSSVVGGLSLRNNGTEYLTIGNANASSATDVDIWHTQNGYMRLATNNQERLRITSAGLVGVGTSSPSSLLHVSGGDILLSNAFSLSARNNANTLSLAIIRRNTSDNVVIDPDGYGTLIGSGPTLVTTSAGRVGVGTTPSTLLHIQSTDPAFRFKRSDAGTDAYGELTTDTSGLVTMKCDPANAAAGSGFRITVDNSEALRVDSSRRLGIGTSSPVGKVNSVISQADTASSSDTTLASSFLHLGGGEYGSGRYFLTTYGYSTGRTNSGAYVGALGTDSTGYGKYALVFGTRDVTTDTAPTERLRITPSGNVGIGTNPLAKFHVNLGTNENIHFATGGSGDQRIQALNDAGGTSVQLSVQASPLLFRGAGGTEVGRWDSSGRLLVGTSSAQSGTRSQYSKFTVQGNNQSTSDGAQVNLASNTNAPSLNAGDTLGQVIFTDNGPGEYGKIACQMDGAGAGTNDYPGRLVFSTTADGASSPTERMRIKNTGDVLIYSTNGFNIASSSGSGTSSTYIDAFYGATGVSTGTRSFIVYTNGNVLNTNNSYGALSDAKLKENIVDANSQWDDIKALQVRNYNFKEGQTHTQIGLIAQEVELVSPGLVTESPDRDEDGNDLGTVTKSVNYSVLYMKAVKALQEAMERIETLEAKVAALESA